jgi:hypothetical protein
LDSDRQVDTRNDEARADSLFLSGCFPEAAQRYRQVLQREPGRLDIQSRLGRLALLENRPQRAIELLADVLNKGLRSKANWEVLADAYLANDELGAAALCYERAGRSGLAGTLAVMARQDPCRIIGTGERIELPWLAGTNLPVVAVQINGMRLNLLVDTAAGDLVLDEKVAIAAEIPHGGREPLHFAGGLSAMVTYGHVRLLQLGEFIVYDVLTQILDLHSRLAAYTPTVPIHGILGISILSRFTTVLDFHRRVLGLHRKTLVASPQETDQHSAPFWIADNQFVLLRADTADHKSSLWVIDTGMSGAAFAVSSASAEAAGLTLSYGTQEEGVSGGGKVQGQRVCLARLRLGDVERRNLEGMALERLPLKDRFGFHIAGLLACEFFQQAVLALDFSRMRLTIEPYR